MEDPQFRQILDRFGFSWAGYRRVRKGVKKRLAHHMQETGCRTIEGYIKAIRSTCFETLDGERFALKSRLREGIRWLVHHLLSDPPGKAFDLIFLRNNLLTYYTDEVKIPAARKVVEALAPGGFLVIGSHEKLPIAFPGLKHWEDSAFIFQRQP